MGLWWFVDLDEEVASVSARSIDELERAQRTKSALASFGSSISTL